MRPSCSLDNSEAWSSARVHVTRHNSRPMAAPTIRSALPADEPAWRGMWRSYCDFYGAELPNGVTDRTWKRILDPDSAIMCIVAEVEGKVYGFANCVVHENTWENQPVCYLEDLFVVPSARSRGIGKALIEWLRNAMRAEGWARIYWVTREDNTAARRLYDQFTSADGFVRYVIAQK